MLQAFLLCLKRKVLQIFKSISSKKVFPSVYIIDKTCFGKYFLDKCSSTNASTVCFELLEEFDISLTKQLVMAGDFNLFFNLKLKVQGGNPTLKKNFLAKLIEFKETYDLCDIWRVRNTKSKRFTFTQNHSSGFIQGRLVGNLIVL